MSELSPSSSSLSSTSHGTSSSVHKDQAVLLPPPNNLTLLTSGIDPDGKAYVQISWLPPLKSSFSPTTSDTRQRPSPFAPVDRYRITWHEQTNPKEEYRKTIDGVRIISLLIFSSVLAHLTLQPGQKALC